MHNIELLILYSNLLTIIINEKEPRLHAAILLICLDTDIRKSLHYNIVTKFTGLLKSPKLLLAKQENKLYDKN